MAQEITTNDTGATPVQRYVDPFSAMRGEIDRVPFNVRIPLFSVTLTSFSSIPGSSASTANSVWVSRTSMLGMRKEIGAFRGLEASP